MFQSIFKILALALLLLGSSMASAEEFPMNKAVDAYQKGDFAEAAKWYRVSADAGEASSQYNLGLMYLDGKGLDKDSTEAAKWLRKAADQDNAGAQNLLGILYETGDGVETDVQEAAKLYQRSADQYNADAQYSLALLYANGNGLDQNFVEAYKLLALAAEGGNQQAPAVLTQVTDAMAPDELSQARERFRIANLWGMIAAGYSNGELSGFGAGQGKTDAVAETQALAACKTAGGTDCGIRAIFRMCGVLFSSKQGIGTTSGPSKQAAEAGISKYCKADDGCKVVLSVCNQ